MSYRLSSSGNSDSSHESEKAFDTPSSPGGSIGQKKRKRDLVGEVPDTALDEDQLAKRLRRRELNKQAARQSRARKQTRIEELEMKVRELNDRNEALEHSLKLKQREHNRLLAMLRSHGLSPKTLTTSSTTGRVVTAVMSVAIIAVALSDRVLQRALADSFTSHSHTASPPHHPALFSATASTSTMTKERELAPSATAPASASLPQAPFHGQAAGPTAPLTPPVAQRQFVPLPSPVVAPVVAHHVVAPVATPIAAPASTLNHKPRLQYPRGWISELPSHCSPPLALPPPSEEIWPGWQDFGLPTEGVPLSDTGDLLCGQSVDSTEGTESPLPDLELELLPNCLDLASPALGASATPSGATDLAFLSV